MTATFTRQLTSLRDSLGTPGMASLAMIVAGLLFLTFWLKPLEQHNQQLAARLAAAPRGGALTDPSAKLAAFYGFFEKREDAADWLARLDELAKASGVQMSSGRYQMQDTGTPLQRYEVTLPLSGSYSQIRSFLEKALAQIPVLSVDQLSFRRKAPEEARVQADVRLSLHLMRSANAVAPGAAKPAPAPAAPALERPATPQAAGPTTTIPSTTQPGLAQGPAVAPHNPEKP